jgi:MFS family permease
VARGPFFAFASFGAYWGAWGVLLPDIKERTGASVSQLGLALLVVAATALPAMLVTGAAIDRFGSRIVVVALASFAAAVVLPGLAGSLPELVLVLVVVGAASGAVDVVINVAATALEASSGRRLIQVAHALFSAGFLAGSVGTGLAREAGVGPLPVLLVVAGANVIAVLLNRRVELGGRAGGTGLQRPSFAPVLVLLGILCAVAFVVEGGIEAWSALFLESELDAGPAVSGLGPGLFAAAMVAGRLAAHGLEKRLGDRRLLAAGGLTAAIGLLLAATAPSAAPALAGFLLGGAGVSVAAPTLFGLAGRGATAATRGGAIATVTTLSYLGFVAGPPLIGGVSGAFDLRAGVGLLGAIAFALAITSLALRRLDTIGGR